jgi:hypothetical protein
MTPLQAAKAHCANYQVDGSCLGIYYHADVSVDHSRCKPCDRCLLADGERCSYFEEILVPMRMSRETAEAKARANKKEAAVKTYLKLHDLIPSKTPAKRMCCECRRVEVEGKAELCERCAYKRKLTQTRQSKWRGKHKARENPETHRQGRKIANSPIGAEALTKAETQVGYHYSKTSISGSSFPTPQRVTRAP